MYPTAWVLNTKVNQRIQNSELRTTCPGFTFSAAASLNCSSCRLDGDMESGLRSL